jgi:hypothetical protein
MPAESLFFYLPPDLTSEGASEFLNKMFEKISPSTYREPHSFMLPASSNAADSTVDGVRTVFDILQQRTASGELLNDDMGWDAIHAARAKLGLKKNSDITLPLRHALTGRKVSNPLIVYG